MPSCKEPKLHENKIYALSNALISLISFSQHAEIKYLLTFQKNKLQN